MRIAITALLALALVGCASPEHDKAVMRLDERMSPEWLKQHVVLKETTKDDVLLWLGSPVSRTSAVIGGATATLMPDEIWVYATRFDTVERKGLDFVSRRWVRSVSFSFKDNIVVNYASSESGH